MHKLGRLTFLLALFVGVFAVPATAGAVAGAGDDDEFDAVHHVSDGHYLDFKPIGIVELPRIFVVRRADGSLGLDVFGSTNAAYVEGGYRLADAYSDEATEAESTTQELGERVEEGFEGAGAGEQEEKIPYEGAMVPPSGELVLDLSLTRHLVFAWIGSLILLIVVFRLAGRYKRGIGRETAPKGLWQNMMETVILFVRDDIVRPNLGDKTPKFLPYLLTIFFFILFCNLIGLVPFGATATSNLMITAVLSIFTFFMTQIGGSRDYWMHVFNPPGVPGFVKPILVPIEILGLFTKPFALAIRLFANMTAGHLVILSLFGLIFIFGSLFGTVAGYGVAVVSVAFSIFIYFLELLVALIQAYVFTMLSALFIGMAVEEHHHHDHEDLPITHELDPHLTNPVLAAAGDGAPVPTAQRQAVTA